MSYMNVCYRLLAIKEHLLVQFGVSKTQVCQQWLYMCTSISLSLKNV